MGTFMKPPHSNGLLAYLPVNNAFIAPLTISFPESLMHIYKFDIKMCIRARAQGKLVGTTHYSNAFGNKERPSTKIYPEHSTLGKLSPPIELTHTIFAYRYI